LPRFAPTLGDAARHALKTSVHHELIRRMDLEKLAEVQADDVGGRQRLLAVILQLISEQNAPLSAPDRDRLAHDILDEVFGLGPWNRCCTIPR
jgi:pilus assembly protein CpaF